MLDAYGRALRLGDLMWQHHFEFLLLGYGAYATFADFCKGHLPDIPDQHIAQMVAGIDVLLFKPDAELRRLARLAIDTGVDGAFVEGRTPDEIDAELERSEAGRSWLVELEQVKDPWFNMATGDGLYHYYRSWLDDPSIPYASLIGHIAALRAGEEIERPTEEIQRERDRLAEEYGALLDEDARGPFNELLGLSRTVFPYVEEHKFFCDYWFLTRWWNKIREFGALLAEHGFLARRRGHLPAHAPRGRHGARRAGADVGDRRRCRSARSTGRRSSQRRQELLERLAELDAAAGDRRDAGGGHRPDDDHAVGRHHRARPGVGAPAGGRRRADRRAGVARRRRGPRAGRQVGRTRSPTCARARSSSAASPRRPGRRSSRRSGPPSPTSAA